MKLNLSGWWLIPRFYGPGASFTHVAGSEDGARRMFATFECDWAVLCHGPAVIDYRGTSRGIAEVEAAKEWREHMPALDLDEEFARA